MLKLLVVDDEEFIQETICEFFRSRGYDTYGASSGEEALTIVQRERPHLVFLDIMLGPAGMDGFETLKKIKELDRTVRVIIVTGKAVDDESKRTAESLGANDYIPKPLDYDKLEKEAIPKIGAQLFEDFRREADENRRLYEELQEGMLQTITALAKALDTRDRYTFGHSERVARYSVGIAEILGFSEQEQELIRIGGLLHDIGKIGISDEVLRKPARLTQEEFNEIKRHPREGAKILESVPRLRRITDIVLHHHERYDGKGYPDGLGNRSISQGAQIVAVADTFDNMASWIVGVCDAYDAMTSPRPYRDASSHEAAIAEIARCKGTQFDPKVVDAFMRYYKRNKDLFTADPETVDYRGFPLLFVSEHRMVLEKIRQSLNGQFTINIATNAEEACSILDKEPDTKLALIFQEISDHVYEDIMNAIKAKNFPTARLAFGNMNDTAQYDELINKCQVLKYLFHASNPYTLKTEIMKSIEEITSRSST